MASRMRAQCLAAPFAPPRTGTRTGSIGPASCRRYSNSVTTPKFHHPHPRIAQYRSACLLGRGMEDPAVGERRSRPTTDCRGHPGLTGQPTHAATEGQAADAGVADHRSARPPWAWVAASRSRSTPPPARATFPLGVDGDLPHPAEVDDQTAVHPALPRRAVRPAPDGDLQPLRLGIPKCGDDVRRAAAPREHRGTAVDVGVPQQPGLVVVRFRGETTPAIAARSSSIGPPTVRVMAPPSPTSTKEARPTSWDTPNSASGRELSAEAPFVTCVTPQLDV